MIVVHQGSLLQEERGSNGASEEWEAEKQARKGNQRASYSVSRVMKGDGKGVGGVGRLKGV